MNDFDVIVVGAGPAGATAALRLGKAGVRTLLLEKAKSFPREKPCGGGITARALVRFPYLAEVFQRIAVNPIPRVTLESPDGSSFVHEDATPMMHLVRRWEFDAALFELAKPLVQVELGATVQTVAREDSGVKVALADGRSFTARLVIGADSVNSVVARQMGLREGDVRGQLAIDMMEETPNARLRASRKDTVSLFLIEAGYGYIFPKVEHTNLGFGCTSEFYQKQMRGKGREHHLDWVGEMKSKLLVEGDADLACFRAFPIPFSGPQTSVGERVLLAGDAGGFVNAFTAEGIVFSMITGELAADAAVAAVRKRDSSAKQLRGYERAWKAEIGAELQRSVEIKHRIFNDSGRIDSLARAAARDARLAKLFIDYSLGAARYEELRSYMLRSSVPQWVMGRVRSAMGFAG